MDVNLIIHRRQKKYPNKVSNFDLGFHAFQYHQSFYKDLSQLTI